MMMMMIHLIDHVKNFKILNSGAACALVLETGYQWYSNVFESYAILSKSGSVLSVPEPNNATNNLYYG